MDEKFNNSILQLKNNQYAGILVETKDALGNYSSLRFTDATGKSTTTATSEILTSKYGSVENFFEHLFKNNVTSLRITNRKKNGNNAFKVVGEPYEFTMLSATKTEATPAPTAQPIQNAQQPVFAQNTAVNYGMHGAVGLSAPDSFKLINHDILKDQVAKLEMKLEASEKEVKRLYEENLRNDIQGAHSVQKAEANAGMLGAIAPMLQPFLQNMAGNMAKQPVGLSAPVGTEVQKQFTEFVMASDESFLKDLYKIGQKMISDESFDAKIVELLNT